MNKYTEAADSLFGNSEARTEAKPLGNKYEQAATELDGKRKSALGLSINQSVDQQPDELAYIRKLSSDTGLSPYIVRENKPEVERRVKQRELGKQVSVFSQTAQQWLASPDNLGVAQDDLPALKALDDAIRNRQWYEQDAVDKLLGSVKTGALNVRQSISATEAAPAINRVDVYQAVDGMLDSGDRTQALAYVRENENSLSSALKSDLLRYIGAEPEERTELRARVQEQIASAAGEIAVQEGERQAIPTDPGQAAALQEGTVSAVLDAIVNDPGILPRLTIESLITSAPALVAGAATGPVGAAGSSFGIERGLGVVEAIRAAGIDTTNPDNIIAALTDPNFVEESSARAGLKAFGVSLMDLVGAGIASRSLSPVTMGGRALSGRQREVINLFTQMPVQGAQEASGEALGQYLSTGEVNVAEATLEGVGGAAGSTADVIAFSGGRVFDGIVKNANQARRAKKDKAYLTAVKDAAAQTKLKDRDPQALKTLLDKLGKDGPVDEIYINAGEFQELFQSQNLDPEEYAQKMESVGEQYYESLVTGGDIAISLSDFARVIAPTAVADEFIARSRTQTDGMSPSEADQWIAEKARPTLDAIMRFDEDQAGASGQRVFDDVVGQLIATGMDRGTAERNASLYRAFFSVMGDSEGVDPFDLYQQYSLSVTRSQPDILKRRDNGVDALDPLLDRLRAGEVPTDAQIYGDSLTEFLRKQGGIRDDGGELAARDADTDRKAFQMNLIKDGGMTLDEAAERAVEEGFIQERDINQLLEAVDKDLRGDAVYRMGQENADLRDMAADLMGLQEELDRLGLSVAGMDNPTLKAELEKIVYGNGQVQAGDMEFDQNSSALRSDGQSLRFVNPVALVDGGRISGFTSSTRRTLFGYDQNGELFTLSAEQFDPATVAPDQKRGDRSAERLVALIRNGAVELNQSSVDETASPGDTSGIEVEEVTDSEEIRRILEKYQRGQGAQQQVSDRTVAGGQADQSWRQATSIRGNDGQPAKLYRGSSRKLSAGDFQPESLGFATQNPSAPLGVWFTSDRSDAGRYGQVTEYYADLRNPRVYSSDEVPQFNSPEEAAALREELQAEGHDGLVFDYSDIEGPIHAVAFNAEQVIEPGTVEFDQSGTDAFQAWFGDSKVVDEQGQPLVVYHGTTSDITEFRPSESGEYGPGIYLTYRPESAAKWASIAGNKRSSDVKIMPLYVRMEKPFITTKADLQEMTLEEDADEEPIGMREVHRRLQAEGYDGIIGTGLTDSDVQIIAFRPEQIKSATGNRGTYDPTDPSILHQDVGGKRGVIRIDRANRNFNIELLAKADLSTFLHESGHFFLEVLGDMAERENASDRVKAQYQTLLDWFGVESRADIATEQHEQFARGFEAYLMEGKAPTPELQSIFSRFRAWLLAIYKRLTALDVDLTEEVRNVMDRLLATDEEIERARGEAGMDQAMSDLAALDWTAAEREQYGKLVAEAREAAVSELTTRQMKDLKRTEQDWYKQEKASVRAEVAREVNRDPVYQALSHLQHGKMPDGSELMGYLKPVKLSREALVAEYGAEFLKRLPGPKNKDHGGPYLYSREGGVAPQVLADIYGFSSGDHLIQSLANARPMNAVIEAETDARMRERYPDINLSGEVAEAAIAAVHNDKAAERMLLEMKKLHGKSRYAQGQMTPARVMRQAAERLVRSQRVKDIRPDLYRRAEAKASRSAFEAATNNDFDLAYEQKQKQLLNHYLYREATAAREDAEKVLTYVKRFDKASTRQRIGKAGGDYLEQIDALIDQYEFRRVSLRQINRRRSLQEWMQEQAEQGLDPAIPESVARQAARINYRELPVEELMGIYDAIQSIAHLAKTKNSLLSSQYKREFAETVDDIVSSIEASHTIKEEPPQFVRGKLSQLKDWGDTYVAAHAKPEFIFEYLDGNQSMGPVWQALFKPIADAENAENKMTGEAMEKLTQIMEPFQEAQRGQWFAKKFYVPEIGVSMTKGNMIALALNWGNEGNREAVMNGYEWNQQQVDAVLNRLTEAEWKMVQGIWDLVDSFWPQISQLQKDLVGVSPEKVEATPVQTPYGTLRGGYYPLKYDPRSSFLQFKRDEGQNTEALFENNFIKPATKKGHTIERVGSAGQQVRLDMAVLGEHLYQVIHDVTHRKAIIDVDRLMSNVRVRKAIEGSAGREPYRQLRPWLQAVANDTRQPTLPWERVISHMRGGATIVNMGWKFTTAIVQPLGYLQSVDQIGAKWAWKGLRDFYGNPAKMKKQIDFVFARSEAMKNRQRTFDRDVRDYARKLEKAGKMDAIRQSFFWMTGMLDMSVSVPTWLGAYRKAMEGNVENVAKGDEAGAIDYADQAVRESQSSGAVKDLARIQRGNEAFRAFTMFYSYFSALFNLLRRRRQDLALGNINMPQFVASMATLWLAPAVLGELVAMRGPDDDEEWARWAAQQSILYPLQSMIGIRDVANAALTPFGFGASPAYDGLEQTARALQIPYKVASGEEFERSDMKSIILATSYWGHLPGRQTWITGEYLFDLMEGKERPDNPAELAKGVMFSRPANER